MSNIQMYKFTIVFVLLLVNGLFGYGQQLNHLQLTDSIFNSPQLINILEIEKEDLGELQILIAVSDSLERTSRIAVDHNAKAAINGGFFNVERGYSVSFIEIEGRLRYPNISTSDMLNASLIIEREGDIIIQNELPDSIFLQSNKEKAILGAGPLLLQNAYKIPIPRKRFSSLRHPRTCVCERKNDLLFITVDGRRPNAYGMSLYELQDYLLSLDCIDAINMDGGGSTTMWIKGKGIVNQPSDFSGERKVSNVILILKNEDK